MDPVDDALVGVAEVDPESKEAEVGDGEEKEEGGELGESGGEVIPRIVAVDVVDLGAHGHGDGGLGCAIGEEEGVLVRGGNWVGVAEGASGGWGEVAEVEQRVCVVGVQNAKLRVLLDLHQDLQEGLLREEEEAQPGRFRRCERGGHRDGGDGDRHVPGVGETEFLKEDHGAGVGGDA